MQRYVGESEEQLRRLFAEARRNAPSLMLLDEVDALCPKQRSSHNDIERRVIACMCSQLDAIVSYYALSNTINRFHFSNSCALESIVSMILPYVSRFLLLVINSITEIVTCIKYIIIFCRFYHFSNLEVQ